MRRAKLPVARPCQALDVSDLSRQVKELEVKIDQILDLVRSPVEKRGAYSIKEVSEMLDTSLNTIRIWCRHGRINATRRAEKSGGAELWSIAAEEIRRYRDQGLLPIDPGRNAR